MQGGDSQSHLALGSIVSLKEIPSFFFHSFFCEGRCKPILLSQISLVRATVLQQFVVIIGVLTQFPVKVPH